ncbi:hypothetical protein JL720_2769 [Aureococcus anophagefferens]|nr:hypothetical protein JL720_2769 [Aureococcus anophagefferens]
MDPKRSAPVEWSPSASERQLSPYEYLQFIQRKAVSENAVVSQGIMTRFQPSRPSARSSTAATGPATAPLLRRDAAQSVHAAQRALSPDAGAARPGLRPAAFVAAPDESEPSSRNDDGDFSSDSDDDDAAAPHVWSPRNPNPARRRRRERASAAADGAKPAFSPISPKKAIRKGFPQCGASLQPALPDHHSPPFAWASPGAGLRELDFTPSLRARGLDAPPEGDGEG